MPEKRVEDIFDKFISPTKRLACEQMKPYHLDFEINNVCPQTCKICYTRSDLLKEKGHHMPEDKIFEVIDDLVKLEFKHIFWGGGEPLLHPDIWEVVTYAKSRGINNGIFSGGLPLYKKEVAKMVCEEYERRNLNVFAIHIDTIDPDAFSRLHLNPGELDKRVQGYKNLLEFGFPPERIFPCLTLTSISAEKMEETIDWYMDEMGAKFIEISIFKTMVPAGIDPAELEPRLSDVKRVFEYRAEKMGSKNWARIGSTECSTIQCRTTCCLTHEGYIKTCGQMPLEFAVGNIYKERFYDIYQRNREKIAYRDLRVKGRCAQCENNDLCVGCRAAAYHYLGDVEAADPKCWLNPEAKELYLSG